MANGYFERGEIYWVKMGVGVGAEMNVTRPGLIVSNDKMNNTAEIVSVVFLTTKTQHASFSLSRVVTYATGREACILCGQVHSVDKSRLTSYLGTVTPDEMREVEDCLEELLDLGYVDDTAVKEKETEIAARDVQIKELREEVAKLKSEIAARDDSDMAVKVEIAMWQRLYEKALDQLCAMKLTGDVTRRVEKKAPVEETPKKQVESEPVVEDEPKLVDINTAKFAELRACGMSSNIALSVINNRPYKSVEDLKKVSGFTNTMYGIMSKKVCCVVQPQPKKIASALVEPDIGYEVAEPSTGKVNINTAKAKELKEALGIGTTSAYSVTGYRKKNGLFKSLEELADVPNWSEKMVAKYRDRLEV